MQTVHADAKTPVDRLPEKAQDHLWFLENMDAVHRAIQSASDVEQMMSDVLDVVLSIFECDRALLTHPCDPATTSFRIPMRRTRPGFECPLASDVEYPATPDVLEVYRAVTSTEGPLRLGTDVPLPAQVKEDLQIQSALGMAIYPKVGKPYHFVVHQCTHVRQWTREEQRLFEEIGRRLADALTTLLMLRDLRRSELRLAEAERVTHVAYVEREVATGRVLTSEEGFRILGLPIDRQWTSLAEVLSRVHPSDRAMLSQRAAGAREGAYHDIQYRIIRPNGEVRFIHSRGDLVEDESGRPSRILGIIQDITDHKRAEYLTRQVFDSSPDGIAIVGTDFRYRRANPAYERTLHVPPDGAVGMHMAEVLGDALFETVAKPNLDRCFAGEEVQYANWVEVPFGRRYASVSYTPLRLDTERIEAALIVVSDLTEHMLAQDGLQKAQTELAHMARATTLAAIGSSIAHEVNQPLAAIVMSGNACRRWLDAEPPNLEEAREASRRIVNDGNRASEIVGRIRTLLQGGEPVKEPVELNELIRDTLALVQGELNRRKITAQTDLRATGKTIVGDRVQLQQVLVNLILNGADAMDLLPTEDRKLTIRSMTGADSNAVIEVEDTGVGFDAHDAARIFDAFYSTKSHGLGMGLPISRSIIEAHGGALWATANNGPGVTLHFTLPADSDS